MQPLWNKQFLIKIKGFDEQFVRLQDVELHTRALLEGAVVVTFPHLPKDSNFRIDENRFGNKIFKHLQAFSTGAIQYYKKFIMLLKHDNHKKALTSTLLETLSNVCFQYKLHKITKQEFLQLSNNLIECCSYPKHKTILVIFVKIYSLSPIHPKGLKKLITKMLGN
jgi:predicted glycosyltransferase involved in capsule biosynthesis